MIKDAILWGKLENGRVECYACARKCKIPIGSQGFCFIRKNIDGELKLASYGKLASLQLDPIEKKPFNHFMPGAYVLGAGTSSCNWNCHPSGTKILLADGKAKTVEELRLGDELWSYDIVKSDVTKSMPTPNIITEIRTREAELWSLWWGSATSERIISKRNTLITADHLVLTKDSWKQIQDIRPGDYVLRVWVQHSTKRVASQKQAKFMCTKCGASVNGVSNWAKHHNKCYAADYALSEPQRVAFSERMKSHNPMKNPASIRKMRETVKSRLLSDPNYGLHKNIERFRKSLHKHPSSGQLILYQLLDELGFEYEKEYILKPEIRLPNSASTYILDAALVTRKVDIEIDGWWHFHHEETKKRDIARDETLKANGWRVLRIPGSTIYNHGDQIKELILAHVNTQEMKNDKHWVRVLDIKPTGRIEKVYGFECIPNHTYVADGILMHNCQFCQNHYVSKERDVVGVDVSPQELVDMALREGAKGIAFTYNEPTIFIEYTLDVSKIAHKHGLSTMFVTNGYMTPEAVQSMKGNIDAAVVDFKGNGDQKFANKYEMVVSNEPIKDALLEMKKAGIHIEITDLIVPTVGDSLEACDALTKWIAENLGKDTPMHFTRFHPDYKMLDYPSTPMETLVKHYEIAKKNGLNYVYVGNVHGNKYENTYCPKCGKVAIERIGFDVVGWRLDKNNKCKHCSTQIPVVGKFEKPSMHRDIVALY